MPLTVGASPAYYVPEGAYVALQVQPMVACVLGCRLKVVYEDGSEDLLTIDEVSFTAGTTQYSSSVRAVPKPGIIVAGFVYGAQGSVPGLNTVFVRILTTSSRDVAGEGGAGILACIGQGYVSAFTSPCVGLFEPYDGTRYALAEMLVTYTQSVAGTFILDITSATSGSFIVNQLFVVYTGTNSLQIRPMRTGASVVGSATWVDLASAASNVASVPRANTTPATTGDTVSSDRIIMRSVTGVDIRANGAGGGADVIVIFASILVSGFLPVVTAAGTGTWAVSSGTAAFAVQ